MSVEDNGCESPPRHPRVNPKYGRLSYTPLHFAQSSKEDGGPDHYERFLDAMDDLRGFVYIEMWKLKGLDEKYNELMSKADHDHVVLCNEILDMSEEERKTKSDYLDRRVEDIEKDYQAAMDVQDEKAKIIEEFNKEINEFARSITPEFEDARNALERRKTGSSVAVIRKVLSRHVDVLAFNMTHDSGLPCQRPLQDILVELDMTNELGELMTDTIKDTFAQRKFDKMIRRRRRYSRRRIHSRPSTPVLRRTQRVRRMKNVPTVFMESDEEMDSCADEMITTMSMQTSTSRSDVT